MLQIVALFVAVVVAVVVVVGGGGGCGGGGGGGHALFKGSLLKLLACRAPSLRRAAWTCVDLCVFYREK